MTIKDLEGTFTVMGSNQSESNHTYEGTLSLSVDNDNRIQAIWLIHNEQEQFGKGFFKDNILVVNFYYLGEDDKKFKGVVVYRCLTPDILDGFWSEKYGDPAYLGEERCFRVKATDEVLE
ncbi:hypothetical protein ACJOV8_001700 [Formosa sp. 3Alg 14/1]|uniref:hypothetical protein n=1 Tax=Formosa sp. 3Alg 14/1 TaxID=3382190 RepID=UPI0039BEBCEC